MGILDKIRGKGEEEENLNAPPGSEVEEEQSEEQTPAATGAGNLNAQVARMQAQLEGVGEMRKATNERFSRVTEQIGELRGMILETGKSMQKMELTTTKAVGLVESIEPDKFLVMIRKMEAKIEALKGGLDTKEVMMQTIMDELKDMRQTIRTFRGIEQVIKMTDEVKEELTNIRKVKAMAEQHADKVETFFTEIQRRVRGFDIFESNQKDIKNSVTKLNKAIDQVNVKILQKADKREVEALINNFKEFEDHTSRIIRLLNKEFNDVRKDFEHRFDMKFRRAERINKILQDLVKPTPELKKSLEGVKKLAEEELRQQAIEEARRKRRPGFIGKLLGRKAPVGDDGEESEGEESEEGEESKEDES